MSIDGFSDVSSARLANILNMRLILTAVAVTNIAVPSFAGAPELVGTTIVSGFEPHIEASGLKPGQRVRVHAVRMFSTWERAPTGGWRQAPKPLHSWADFLADEEGRIRLWRASPLSGTYAGIDGYGLLWSGRAIKADAPNPHLPADISFKDMKDGETTIILADGDAVLAHRPLTTASAPGIRVVDVAKGRINGAYAAPADGKRHPALILLHGSEGGDRDAARSLAIRFAGQGYAAFSFNYFAWDLKKLVGVPNAHVNQPIEMISAVRDWLKEQPEADVKRLGLYGHSKGAEYAELAAAYFPWVRAVAACVPTDVVWQGYGIGDERNQSNPFGKPPKEYSSFSWKGRPLPYVPLEGDRSGYYHNSDFYEAKRREYPKEATSAEIMVEKSKASFLWLGGGRDATWASGRMAERLDARMRAKGIADRSELHVYDTAGHSICGDGTYPTRLWEQDSTNPRDPDRDAEGRATINGWNQIKAFFSRTLK